jgi:hypothetical protein
MSNKQEFIKFLTETSEADFSKFHIGFGYDDWCASVMDFPEAFTVLVSKNDCYSDVLDWKEWLEHRKPEEQRNIILNEFKKHIQKL